MAVASAADRDLGGDTVDTVSFRELRITGNRAGDGIAVTRRGRVFTVRSLRGTVVPGRGCVRSGSRRLVCNARGVSRIRGRLGAGNDRLDLRGVRRPVYGTIVDGQGGNDGLLASRGGATLRGGDGTDSLTGSTAGDDFNGGPGGDRVAGGGGNDLIRATDAIGRPAPDRYDGGPGRDHVSYASGRGVSVDLGRGVGGAAGEDRLSALEDATGSVGDDHLVGSPGPNRLNGGPGRDRLLGGGGDDFLATEEASSPQDISYRTSFEFHSEIFDNPPPDEAVDGGDGADRISLAGGEAGAEGTAVTCGGAADRVVRSTPTHRLPADCEAAELPGFFEGAWTTVGQDENERLSMLITGTFSAYPRRIEAGRAIFSLSCPPRAPAQALPGQRPFCKGTLAVNASGAAFDLAPGGSTEVAVPLRSEDVSRLGPGFDAQVTVQLDPSRASMRHEPPAGIGWTVRLRA